MQTTFQKLEKQPTTSGPSKGSDPSQGEDLQGGRPTQVSAYPLGGPVGKPHNRLLVLPPQGVSILGSDAPPAVSASTPSAPGPGVAGGGVNGKETRSWYGKNKALQRGWVQFIHDMGDRIGGWDWFSTWTFRNHTHPESGIKAWRKMMHYVNRQAYGVRYHQREGVGVSSIVCIENQQRGVIHFHSLDGGTNGARRLDAMDNWFKMAGIARVYPFRKDGGAEAYVAKYIVKGQPWREFSRGGDIFLSGSFGIATERIVPRTCASS